MEQMKVIQNKTPLLRTHETYVTFPKDVKENDSSSTRGVVEIVLLVPKHVGHRQQHSNDCDVRVSKGSVNSKYFVAHCIQIQQ